MSDLKAQMQARFHELNAKIKAVSEELAPLTAERDALAEQEAKLRSKIKDIGARKLAITEKAGLQDMAAERTRIVRFLDGKTGVPH